MITRLYYSDANLTSFSGTVTESGTLPDGRSYAVLDRTAFYPTSGGQPHDLGVLGGVRVLDVVDREEDGSIVHVLESPLASGHVVAGEIDAARRRDHVQQHTGQHVLSAAFVHACNAPTVSFHLGADTSTIDVTATLDASQVARGEDEANRIVWEDRAVSVRYASAEEAAALPLRKESKRTGTLRLVDIEDWDLSACGGTHVSRTGSIGAILVTGWERYKGGTRIAFACGDRAVRYARALRDVVTGATRLLSIKPEELVDAVTRLQAEAKEVRLQARTLGESLAAFEAERFVREASASGTNLVAQIVDRDANGLKALAQAVAALGASAVLVSKSRPCLIVAARSAGSANEGFDASAVVKALISRFGGKGGGRPEMAQAGGIDAEPNALLEAIATS
jgi:alanyl-tRNA synthetase